VQNEANDNVAAGVYRSSAVGWNQRMRGRTELPPAAGGGCRHVERRATGTNTVEANRRAVALSNELYLRGLGNFLNVLDAERWLFSSQSDLVPSETTASTNVVALYKALGGLGDHCAGPMKVLGYSWLVWTYPPRYTAVPSHANCHNCPDGR
jgi:hypothetical protein